MPLDPVERERIRDDLAEVVRGDVLFDDLNRALYSTDASLFQIEPLGVVAPADEADVQAVVKFAAERHLSLVPRGAGTGMAGEALGDGLILDLSRHFRQIVEIGPDWVRAQPGVVLRALNDALAAVGRRFAPDPASGESCTVGGMMANNASGARAVKHGYTRDHVLSCRVVLDSGDAVRAGREPLPPSPEHPERYRAILRETAALLRRHAGTIRASQPLTRFNRCGYLLTDVLGPDALDLPRLLAGSEGTLGTFTELTLRTLPLPRGRSAALLAFPTLETALKAVALTVPAGPAACELFDRRLVALTRSCSPEAAAAIPAAAEAILLVEFEADSAAEARLVAQTLADRIHFKEGLSLSAAATADPDEVTRMWRLRDAALPTLFGLGHGPKPVPFVEDIGVPPEALGRFLTRAQDILQTHELTASFMTHAAAGQVHIRPFLDPTDPADAAKLRPLADALYAVVFEMGGTISTQHGTGLARTHWVERQYGPLYGVFRQLKHIFDPNGLFNPGKIVRSEARSAEGGERNGELRLRPALRVSNPALLHWEPDELPQQIQACNGCGQCRAEAAPLRMCPIFRVTPTEAATPRAKANLLRRVLADPDPQRLSADDVRAVADLCVNCRMCAGECPARVNIPKLMLEAKAAHRAEHGLDRVDWVLARAEEFAALGSRFALVVNPLLESRAARWLLERLTGVSRHRRLPSFAFRTFLYQAKRQGLTRKRGMRNAERGTEEIDSEFRGPSSALRVAYFVDVFANYNDPLIAQATVAVLRHNGVEVFVPPGQVGCGMASLAQGDVETAREFAQVNLRTFAELARDGYRIVCSEPTAALMLQQDYLNLIHDFDAQLVAEQTVELTTFLWELYEQGRLKTDFQPLDASVGHHVPCHLKALGRPPAGPRLLALIPQLRVHTIDVSCSGMAGTYGLKRRNYWASLEAGRPMLDELRHPRVLFGSSECSACRTQMEQGSGKRSLHPVQYLALAYGLVPDIARRLRTPLDFRKYL